jgi:hypothetical protein
MKETRNGALTNAGMKKLISIQEKLSKTNLFCIVKRTAFKKTWGSLRCTRTYVSVILKHANKLS